MPATATVSVRLSDLTPGVTARFHEARLDPELARYLRAIGLTRTSEFRVCQNGEPCILQVRSTRIGLSRALAGAIQVVPVASKGA
jgi:Fe2+ transport system protein FeoA